MVRVPEAADIELQEKPDEEERRREWTHRGSQLAVVVDQSRLQADCIQHPKTGPGFKVVSWEYENGSSYYSAVIGSSFWNNWISLFKLLQ